MPEFQSPGETVGGPTRSATTDNADLKDLQHDLKDTADEAIARGRGFAAAVRSHAQSLAEERKVEAARSVAGIAHSLRDSGRSFDDHPNVKAFFESAADGLEDLAGTIEARSFSEFLDEAEAYARRAPATVAVATFAAGFLLARFVKASGSNAGRGA